jgi:hypothetical protein
MVNGRIHNSKYQGTVSTEKEKEVNPARQEKDFYTPYANKEVMIPTEVHKAEPK